MSEVTKRLQARGDTWCRHRTPFDKTKYPVCQIGVDYHQFSFDDCPCLGESERARVRCPSYSAMTPEELAAREAELLARFERIGTIRMAIVKQIKTTSVRGGHMPCPCCKTGIVGYSQASNGHIHARCSTVNCASWME